MKKTLKCILLTLLTISLAIAATGCGKSEADVKKVVIYTNGDEEAVQAMKTSLTNSGFEGQYVLHSLGTSELGGKLLAEGKNIEADLITMSSYFIESSQNKHDMFKQLSFETDAIDKHPSFYAPILSITGTTFVNTELLEQKGLPRPTSIADLTKPEFKGLVSIPDIMHSSTGWLLIQAIISEYGEESGKAILHDLITNAGPHLESSGSGPLKKIQAGEVAAGFGLRHQAVAARATGIPIDFVDPIEGNFSLTESIAVVNKDNETTDLAMKMAEAILKGARKDLIVNYPVALYKGETIDQVDKPAYPKGFAKPLTVELLQEHQQFFNTSKSGN
ncbi:extracellular solute-binding protein [Paenibacillus arenosi]|uniref:extracellular solute-binding protein n=1 Tax=Paenibacillus arenosi TaxID=2774142 RepID=UPI001CDB8FCC|nr:extracellular solute-binding protein [Paenibacillus arenosi]